VRVALLEDDPDQVALFMEWLKAAGHACEHYDNGKAFVRSIKHDSFDALVLDWMVPDMDGFQVLRWVRENFDWRIPVVFVTARDLEDDIVRALEEGADDYIVKPAKQREFLARLTAVVRRATPVEEGQETIEYCSATSAACCRAPTSSRASGAATPTSTPARSTPMSAAFARNSRSPRTPAGSCRPSTNTVTAWRRSPPPEDARPEKAARRRPGDRGREDRAGAERVEAIVDTTPTAAKA
jgi:CheY-like chemotaxis protein